MVSVPIRKIDDKDKIMDVFPDFEPGPLDTYRRKASFNWRLLALALEDEDSLRLKHTIWKEMEKDPLFAHSPVTPTLDEHRKVTLERAFRASELIPKNITLRENAEVASILGQYDWSVSFRRAILLGFFTNAIRGLGTKKHNKFIHAAEAHQLMGCVAMTEISHGTNVRAFRTTCTYNPTKQKFILHTPDFQAAKCWAGNMGKTANFAYVLAQLYTSNGVCHGLHGFAVPIRDRQMNTFPGVLIGDMGEKVGLNGLDNGFMMFDNYELSLDALLDKNGKVTPQGDYVTPFKDPKKRFGASLGNLSSARIGIVSLCAVNMCNVVTIAIRYSAVRRQFGPSGTEEQPVIEYQMQQWRLFPYLAATYIVKFFSGFFYDTLIDFVLSQFNPDISAKKRGAMGVEIHAISSAAKPIAGWLARDATQECREACGGHGYLKAAGIGRIRDDSDSFLTFEGDNNVLLQQTSNWMVNIWSNPKREKLIEKSPMGALNFLKNATSRLKKTFSIDSDHNKTFNDPKTILQAYKWLICHLLKSTHAKLVVLQSSGVEAFEARNDSQVYHARTLSIAFIEHYILEIFWNKMCCKPDISVEIRNVLTKLLLLYGWWSLEKHLGTLYQGGYFSGPKPATLLRETVLQLCTGLKDEAVALVDAVAPPDFILNSVLGVSDGQVYKHLERVMKQTPGCFEKGSDWASIADRLTAKL